MKYRPVVVAIESSCDESSVCWFDGRVFHEATASSLPLHAALGGVVPEIASREHEIAFPYCLEQLKIKGKVDVVAYTSGPGLPGSLHIGKVVAQTLALAYGARLMPVDHVQAHIFAAFIDHTPVLPMLSLIVSGGHTSIYLVKPDRSVRLLLATPDDAVGEVLDKVGRELGYPYPAGPRIDQRYDPALAQLKFIAGKPFSFSGIKSAAVRLVESKTPLLDEDVVAIGSSLNKSLVDIVLHHLKKLVAVHRPRSLSIGGGVAANRLLRREVAQLGLPCYLPSLKHCQDNAAMVAMTALLLLKKEGDRYNEPTAPRNGESRPRSEKRPLPT